MILVDSSDNEKQADVSFHGDTSSDEGQSLADLSMFRILC